jgi:hypothetical protein
VYLGARYVSFLIPRHGGIIPRHGGINRDEWEQL